MPLEFRGIAVTGPKCREVRFAGYATLHQSSAVVICQVTAEALRSLGKAPNATGDEILDIFECHKERIFRVASQQFDNGWHRPLVTIDDLQAL